MYTRRQGLALLLSFLGFASLGNAQPGAVDPAFHRHSVFNGTVFASAALEEGKVLLGGAFTGVTGFPRNGIVRVSSTGAPDPAFDPGIGIEGAAAAVYAIAVYTNGPNAGKILIGGSFTHFNRVERRGIARLNGDGSLDATFNPGTGIEDGDVYAAAIQADGRVVVGGDFMTVRGRTRNGVARFNADGSLDTGFTPGEGADGTVYGVAVQPDGKILAAGAFTTFRGQERSGVARLTSSGMLDSLSRFDPGTGAEDGFVYALALRADGKIIVGGDFTIFQGESRDGVALLNPDGSIDTEFAPDSGGVGGVVWAVAAAKNDTVVVAGEFTTMANTDAPGITRLDATGQVDLTFTNSGPEALLFSVDHGEYVLSLSVQEDGSIIAAGTFELVDNMYRAGLVRLLPDGAVDRIFNQESGSFDAVLVSLIQPDGKLLLGGRFTLVNGESRRGLARLQSDGLLDPSFAIGSGVVGRVYDLRLYTNGPLAGMAVAGGNFTSVEGFPVTGVARIRSDGSVDTNFAPVVLNAAVNAVVLQPDGKVVIGGGFTNVNGVPRKGIARLNPEGTLDAGFDPGAGVEGGDVSAMAIQGEKLVLAGSFTRVNGEAAGGLARLDAAGALDHTFTMSPGLSGGVARAVLVQPDGQLIVGGSFTTAGETPRHGITRLNSNGTLDTSFKPGAGLADGEVLAIAMQPDGQLVIGGSFSEFNSVPAGGLARLNSDGSFDFGFDPGTGANRSLETVYSVTIQPDGKVFAGGAFLDFNGVETWGFTRVLGGVAIPTPPRLLWWPAPATALSDDVVTLSVNVAGSKPLSYQWFFEHSALMEATNEVLRLQSVSTNESGDYFVVVTNAYGSITSAPISLNVVATVDLGVALEAPGLTWGTAGNSRWYGQTSITRAGHTAAAQSGPLTHDQQAGFSTTVTGPGWLSFWWKVSSEETYDKLSFQFNGADSDTISGEVDWTERTVEIPPGQATVSWIYRKDGVFSAGSDAAWVSEVRYTQVPMLTLGTDGSQGYQLEVQAAPGQRVEIQASEKLTEWTTIRVLTNAVYPFLFLDESSTNYPQRFYRTFTP